MDLIIDAGGGGRAGRAQLCSEHRSRAEPRKVRSFGSGLPHVHSHAPWSSTGVPCPALEWRLREDEPPNAAPLSKSLGKDSHSLLPSISVKLQILCRRKSLDKTIFWHVLKAKIPFFLENRPKPSPYSLEMGLVLLEKIPIF